MRNSNFSSFMKSLEGGTRVVVNAAGSVSLRSVRNNRNYHTTTNVWKASNSIDAKESSRWSTLRNRNKGGLVFKLNSPPPELIVGSSSISASSTRTSYHCCNNNHHHNYYYYSKREFHGTRPNSWIFSRDETHVGSTGMPDWVEKWTPSLFKQTGGALAVITVGSLLLLGPASATPYVIGIPSTLFALIGYRDMHQEKHTILRNFPVLGHVRFLLESVRPEIRQYFIESDSEATPFSREQRSLVYQRAKLTVDSQPFGTKSDLYKEGASWIRHSVYPEEVLLENSRVVIGSKDCKKPYSASLLNISALSYGALSGPALTAMNQGAKRGNFYHNTGEGGISRFHRDNGGDIVWNIGTGYFGCRGKDGGFDQEKFLETVAQTPTLKMIEIKISQGAKPAHGGTLPGSKVTPLIAEARGIEIGKTCHSPARHSAFSSPEQLIEFVAKLRELSGGLPIGMKLCVGNETEIAAIIKAAVKLNTFPDFMTVDGAEGGTGAAPPEFSNRVGMPLTDGIYVVHNLLRGAGIRNQVKVIASGKVSSGFEIVKALSIGADITNAARAMMLATGCVMSLKCHTNKCPTGVATQDPSLTAGLVVEDKATRVYNFQRQTVDSALHLIGAVGLSNPKDLEPKHVMIRTSGGTYTKTYDMLYPQVPINGLFDGTAVTASPELQQAWDEAKVY